MEITEAGKEAVKHLRAEMAKDLDTRDTALCERLGKQFKELIDAQQAALEAKFASFRVPGVANNAPEVKEFSFARLVQGILKNNVRGLAPYEFEMCTAAAAATAPADLERMQAGAINKDLLAGTDSAGGFLVPAQVFVNEIIPLLVPRTIAFKLGVKRRTGLVGSPSIWPRILTDVDMEEVGETEPPTGDDMTFGQMALTPHRMAQFVTISNDLINQSPAAVEQMVRDHLTAAIARKIDRWVFNGTGSGGQPIGVFQATGVNNVAAFGDVDAIGAFDKFNDMIFKVEEDDADVYTSMPKWALNPIHKRDLANIKDPTDNSQPKARRVLSDELVKKIMGLDFETSTLIPITSFAYGFWESVIFGQWGTMVLSSSNVAGNNFRNRTTEIMAYMAGDVGFEHPESLCTATGVTQT